MADPTAEVAMKGAGRCPKCASRAVDRVMITDPRWTVFYAADIESCRNCKAIWERIDTALIWDPDDPVGSFSEPCNNCAFRPGSPEQADVARWHELMESLKTGANFNCHKGVPIDPHSEHGFLYPHRNGQAVRSKLRTCRGYLNMIKTIWDKREAAHG